MAGFENLELGDERVSHPDVSLDAVKHFCHSTGLEWGRFTDHEYARGEGLPGAIVPGTMSQGIFESAIHAFAPGSEIVLIDTVFRAPLLVDSKPTCQLVVTDRDEEARTVEVDLTIVNEQSETRVVGTATVRL